MATVGFAHRDIAKSVVKCTWGTLANTDVGAGNGMLRWPDKTVQITGTFGGATVNIEGSNDGGLTWFVLNDSRGEGNPLTLTAADGRQIMENAELIRPNVSGGGGTTAITVTITATRGGE